MVRMWLSLEDASIGLSCKVVRAATAFDGLLFRLIFPLMVVRLLVLIVLLVLLVLLFRLAKIINSVAWSCGQDDPSEGDASCITR